MRKILLFFIAAIGFVFIVSDLSSVFAQEDYDEFTLEEITVTAQKREENVQKVPITMEVITGDQIKELGQTSVDQILQSLGTAIMAKQADGYHISLRGLTDDSTLWQNINTAMPTVAVTTDGVYSARNSQGIGLYDIERVEVLFGPQSTLYSASTPGGIVNIVTAAPKLDTYEVSGTLEYGNYDYLRTEGVMNAPLGDKTALRAAFSTSVRDGYIDNGTDDEDEKSARLSALFQPVEDLSIRVTGAYKTAGGKGGMAVVDSFVYQSDTDNPWHFSDDVGAPRSTKVETQDIQITWSTDLADINVIWDRSKNENTWSETRTSFQQPDVSFTTSNITHSGERTAEIRMSSAEDFPFKWIAGFNYFVSNVYKHSTYDIYIQTDTYTTYQKQLAYFANVTYPITDLFRFTVGARKTDHTMFSNSEIYNSLTPPGGGTSEPYQTEDGYWHKTEPINLEYGNVDKKLGVEYDLTANSMLYADWSSSYRLQGQSMPGPYFKRAPPEELTAYTIGVKNRFFDNKLQLNISAYYNDYLNKRCQGRARDDLNFYEWEVIWDQNENGVIDDWEMLGWDQNADGRIAQESDFDDPNIEDPTWFRLSDKYISQWGDYMSSGIDLQANWLITNKDTIELNYSFLKDEWTKMDFIWYYWYMYQNFSYTGERNINSPEHSITFAYTHKFHLQNGGVLSTRIDTRYQSEYIVNYSKLDYPWSLQEDHKISNFTAVYSSPDGKWSLSGYVKNIENYATKRSYSIVGFQGESEMRIGPPRTYGAILTVRY